MTAPGMVAENSIVCRLAGSMLDDLLDVGQEAEVEHLVGLVEHERARRGRRLSFFCPARSSSRPGVPTITSTPFFSASTCGS